MEAIIALLVGAIAIALGASIAASQSRGVLSGLKRLNSEIERQRLSVAELGEMVAEYSSPPSGQPSGDNQPTVPRVVSAQVSGLLRSVHQTLDHPKGVWISSTSAIPYSSSTVLVQGVSTNLAALVELLENRMASPDRSPVRTFGWGQLEYGEVPEIEGSPEGILVSDISPAHTWSFGADKMVGTQQVRMFGSLGGGDWQEFNTKSLTSRRHRTPSHA